MSAAERRTIHPDLPSGDPDETTVRIRLEPARRAVRLADTLPAPSARRPVALLAAVLLGVAVAALALR